MKILILIPMWKRPEIVEVMLINLSNTIKSVDHTIYILAILCPHDPHLKELEKLCRKYKVTICYSPNEPLGRKMNAGINYALKRFEFDYLMNFGSDDLIHHSLFDIYKPYFEQNTKVFGIDSLYFFEYDTRRAIFFKTYTEGFVVGAGRMIHKSVFEILKSKRMDLYTDEKNRAMDGDSSNRLKFWCKIFDTVISVDEFPYIVDIKTNTNINHISSIERHSDHCREVDNSVITNHFKL